MKYLFLAYNDEKWWEALSAGEHNAFKDDCLVNNEILRQNGHLLAGEGLHGNSAATTVRVQDGKVCVTDRSFINSNEQLVGIFFINARDLNNALSVASKMPQAQAGFIEVRPLIEPCQL